MDSEDGVAGEGRVELVNKKFMLRIGAPWHREICTQIGCWGYFVWPGSSIINSHFGDDIAMVTTASFKKVVNHSVPTVVMCLLDLLVFLEI